MNKKQITAGLLSTIFTVYATAITPALAQDVDISNTTADTGSTYIGNGQNNDTTTNGDRSINIGTGNTTTSGVTSTSPATFATNIAVGADSDAENGSTVFGNNSTAKNGGLTIGNSSNAIGVNAISIGGGAQLTANAGDTIINSGANSSGTVSGIALTAGQIAISGNNGGVDPVTGQVRIGPSFVMNNTAITFNNGVGGPVVVSGVAPGVAGTDAVNVNQLNAGLAGVQAGVCTTCVTYTDASEAAINLSPTGTIIHNLAAGQASTDAANVGQLQAQAAALGGGAGYTGGVFTMPTYALSGGTFNNVGAALTNLDGRITANTTAITNIQNNSGTGTGATGPQGPVGPQGPQGTPGKDGSGTGVDSTAVHYDSGSSGSATIGGQVHGVQAGTAATDATNVQQLQDAQAATLSSANSYTNQQVSNFQNQINGQQGQINDLYGQVNSLKKRIDGGVAQAMAGNIPFNPYGGDTQLQAGVASYGSAQAIAVNIAHISENRKTIYTIGISGATQGGQVGIHAGVSTSLDFLK